MPPVRPLTILSLRACTWFMSMPTGGLAERQAPLLPVLRDLQRVRVLEQRLGRDAAPVQAGAAEHRRALDDRGLQPELRGADGGDVAAGSGADDDDVVFVGHGRRYDSFLLMEDSGTNDTEAGCAARGPEASAPAAPGRAARPESGGACSRSAAPSTTGSAPRACARTPPDAPAQATRRRAAPAAATIHSDHNRRTLAHPCRLAARFAAGDHALLQCRAPSMARQRRRS